VRRRRFEEQQEVRIGDDGGRAALLVSGVVQSISPADVLTEGTHRAID
jgi:hypothetical protein